MIKYAFLILVILNSIATATVVVNAESATVVAAETQELNPMRSFHRAGWAVGVDGQLHRLACDNNGRLLVLETFADGIPRRITGLAAATGTAAFTIWTPATGKRFHIMGMCGRVMNPSTSGGAIMTLTLFDGSVTITTGSLWAPALAKDADGNVEFIDRYQPFWGEGYVSVAANNKLTGTISPAMATGQMDIFISGKEE